MTERVGGGLSEELANDRTLLAWLRTSISVAGLGFVVARFALFLQRLGVRPVSHHGLSTTVGILLVLSGGALMVVGYRQHCSVVEAVRPQGNARDRPLWPLVVTAATVAGTVLLAVVVIVSNTGSL